MGLTESHKCSARIKIRKIFVAFIQRLIEHLNEQSANFGQGTGIPKGLAAILVEFNDESYGTLIRDVGHGVIGFRHAGSGEAVLPPVPGGADRTPEGTWIEKKNRALGERGSPGYLPPFPGGRGNVASP